MLDFEIQRCTRRCAKTDRELEPGETFFSVLVSVAGKVERRDYSAAAWEGAPEGALGWWKAQMPSSATPKMHWAPNDVMLHYFEQLENDATKADLRYVLALLMIRRRIVRLEETEKDDQGQETLVLFCPRNEVLYKTVVAMPNEERTREIQEELGRLLYAK